MLSIALILILAAAFSIISLKLSGYKPEKRTEKITKPLSVIINLSPFIGVALFGALFAFVLKGLRLERASHALLVFAIWIYATKFYQYILSYYKKKEILAPSVVCMIFSIILAIVFTPLDRYVNLIYRCSSLGSIILGCGLFVVFYAVTFAVSKKQSKTE